MAPSAVNNGARALEGLIARYIFDENTSIVGTLSGSLITLTANRTSLTLTGTTSNYINDLLIGFTMGANPNTGPVRVTINTIGPIELRDNAGVSLSSSVLLAGMRMLMVKDGTNNYFRTLSPVASTSIAGGTGISITASSTINLDIPKLTAETTIANDDELPLYDTTATAARRATLANILDGVGASQAEMEAATAANRAVTPDVAHYHPAVAKAVLAMKYVTGTPTAETGHDYNIGTLDDDGTGLVGVNFTNALSDALYSVDVQTYAASANVGAANVETRLVGSVDIRIFQNTTETDLPCAVMVFGDL